MDEELRILTKHIIDEVAHDSVMDISSKLIVLSASVERLINMRNLLEEEVLEIRKVLIALSENLGQQELELRNKIISFNTLLSAQLKYYNNV